MILDGDQIIYKKEILAPEFTHSGYNAVWTDEKTDEWLMQVKDGIVCSCSRTGGKGGWQLFSVSRWNREDGKRLKRTWNWNLKKNRTARFTGMMWRCSVILKNMSLAFILCRKAI